MSVIQKGGGGDEESPQAAMEKAKSAQQSLAVTKTKLSMRAFTDAAKTNDSRGESMNVHAAKEAELRGNEDPRSTGFEKDDIAAQDGSYRARGSDEDDGDGDEGKSGKSGSSSGGGPSPDLDLSTSDYVSFADSGSGEVVSRKDQKAEAIKAETAKKADAEASVSDAGPREMKITKADGTQASVALPAASPGTSGAAAPAAAAGKSGVAAAPAAPGKSGGGKAGGGGPSAGPG